MPLAKVFRSINDISNAVPNTMAHYDMNREVFSAFLSADMTPSCPIWEAGGCCSTPGSEILLSTDKRRAEGQSPLPTCESEPLEHAQQRKLLRHIVKARIKATDHVLEIGTGWGSFAILAVQVTGCWVTSITLSKEQKQFAQERIEEAGLTDRITVALRDYRRVKISEGGKKIDKIVSIAMLEAVGEELLEIYFQCVDDLLKEDGIATFLVWFYLPMYHDS